MLSDRFRLWKIGTALAALAVLVIYAARVGPQAYPDYDAARKDPAAFADRTIYFSGDVVRAAEGEFTFRTGEGVVGTARGRIGTGQEGFLIAGMAVFRPEGTLDVVRYHVYRYRIYKYLLAVFPLLAVAFFFFRTYAFDFRALVFRARSR
jgi:hypothetical protein